MSRHDYGEKSDAKDLAGSAKHGLHARRRKWRCSTHIVSRGGRKNDSRPPVPFKFFRIGADRSLIEKRFGKDVAFMQVDENQVVCASINWENKVLEAVRKRPLRLQR